MSGSEDLDTIHSHLGCHVCLWVPGYATASLTVDLYSSEGLAGYSTTSLYGVFSRHRASVPGGPGAAAIAEQPSGGDKS